MKHHQQLKYSTLFIVTLIIASLLLAACGGVQAQDKTYTIGVINFAPLLSHTIEGFEQGMAELGYVEGENITYIYEGPLDSMEKLDEVAQDLVAEDVDLILSVTTPATLAAQRATAGTDIPVVFIPVTDPVAAGIVDSLRQPGGNITGITFSAQEERRLEWLIQVVPTIKQVYVPYNSEDPSPVQALKMASEAAAKLGVELITREARNPDEIMAAIENVPEEADAIFLLPDGLVAGYTAEFVALQMPSSAANASSVNEGILTSYGFEQIGSGKQAARLADQIFKGVKPADLPVEVAEFSLAINLKTAETLGLDVPDEILRQADTVVR